MNLENKRGGAGIRNKTKTERHKEQSYVKGYFITSGPVGIAKPL